MLAMCVCVCVCVRIFSRTQTAKSELATRERVLERSRRELQESQRGWELLKASERKCSELESDIGHQRDENESLKTSAQALEQQVSEPVRCVACAFAKS